MDFDALDIGSRSLIDHEGDVDAPGIGIAECTGEGLRKGIAELRQLDREDLGGFVQRVAVEHGAAC